MMTFLGGILAGALLTLLIQKSGLWTKATDKVKGL